MVDVFINTLLPVITLFLFMAIGFALKKFNIVPANSNSVLAKVETWVFCPALSFLSMANSFTVPNLAQHATNLAFSVGLLAIAFIIGNLVAPLFIKDKVYERNIYKYALVFANFGYMADPLVEAMFGLDVLGYYKLFCLPFSICIYTWGIVSLNPNSSKNGSLFKNLLNFPTIAMFAGMIVGISGIFNTGTSEFCAFIEETLIPLRNCYGPVAMILVGMTVANYNVKELLFDKKVYFATLLRLIVLPGVILTSLIGVHALINNVFNLSISNAPIYFAFFFLAMPLGMNTIVFPEAFGGNPKPGASMALISSVASVITIPIMFTLLSLLIPLPFEML